MKNLKHFFRASRFFLMIIFYPAVSFNWYRFCRLNGHRDGSRFLKFGLAGTLGITGLAVMFFLPLRWSIAVGVISGAMYLDSLVKQLNLLSKKLKIVSPG